eukprot:s3009_g9.t1
MVKRRKTAAKEPQGSVEVAQESTPGEAASDASEAASGKAKKKKKNKFKPPMKARLLEMLAAFCKEVMEVLKQLSDPQSRGGERAAIVECDQKKMKESISAVVSIEHPFDANDDDHCETAPEAYRDVAEAAMADLEGGMCWPVEWFKEDLPIESKDGSAMDMLIEKTINRSYHVPKMMDPYVKSQSQDVLEIPKPDTPSKMNILAFSDSMGYCKNLFANAPEGRISMKKVVENYHTLTQEDVKRLVTEPKKGWDMVIFAVGCDPPRSNSIDDVIEQNTVISRLYFWLAYEIQRSENARKIFCLAGLGITVCGTLFGMTNTLRQELEGVDLHFCDTEYFLHEESPLWGQIASEAFRDTTFGMIDVRILESGRYVQKRISSKLYQAANKDRSGFVTMEFPMPDKGVICISGGNGALGLVMGNWLLDKAAEQGKSGFAIQFLSRSMKISDLNMPLWKDIEAKAAKLGVTVEQGLLQGRVVEQLGGSPC